MEQSNPARKSRDLRNTLPRLLRSLVLGLSLTSSTTENVRAAEIPPNTTWSKGVEELQRNTEKDNHEIAAQFYLDKGGNHAWLSIIKGDIDRVFVPRRNIADDLERRLKNENIKTFCYIHTHPKKSTIEGYKDYSRYFIRFFSSPSSEDIKNQNLFNPIKEQVKKEGGDYFAAVFDTQGVWYYRTASVEDLKVHFPEYLEQIESFRESKNRLRESREAFIEFLKGMDNKDVFFNLITENEEEAEVFVGHLNTSYYNPILDRIVLILKSKDSEIKRKLEVFLSSKEFDDFVQASQKVKSHESALDAYLYTYSDEQINASLIRLNVKEESITDTQLLDKIKKAYLISHRALVRFAPYKSLNSEPPCAGPDYVQSIDTSIKRSR